MLEARMASLAGELIVLQGKSSEVEQGRAVLEDRMAALVEQGVEARQAEAERYTDWERRCE